MQMRMHLVDLAYVNMISRTELDMCYMRYVNKNKNLDWPCRFDAASSGAIYFPASNTKTYINQEDPNMASQQVTARKQQGWSYTIY
jgi:hypothetical protein